jgi:DNA polymerase elongation subunit (family B)
MEIITVCPTKWEVFENKENEWDSILCWCLNDKNTSVLVRIEDFPCSFYYELDQLKPEFNYSDATNIHNQLSILLKDNRENLIPFDFNNLSISENTRLLKFEFKNKNSAKHAMQLLSPGKALYNVYPGIIIEYGTDVVKKLLITRGIRYCEWYNCQAKILTDESDKISRDRQEYIVRYKSIFPSNINLIPKPLWLDLCIEVYSNNHRMIPNSLNPNDVIHTICMIFRRDGETTKQWKQYCLTQSEFLIENKEIIDTVTIIKVDNEEKLIECLAEIILKEDPDFISGYNLLRFDNKYINTRAQLYGGWPLLGRLKCQPKNIKILCKRNNAYGISDLYLPDAPGRSWFDIYQYFNGKFKWSSYSLFNAAKETSTKYPMVYTPICAEKQFEIYHLSKTCRLDIIKNMETLTDKILLLGDNLKNKNILIKHVINNNFVDNWKNMGIYIINSIYYAQIIGYIANNINLWSNVKDICSEYYTDPEKVAIFLDKIIK